MTELAKNVRGIMLEGASTSFGIVKKNLRQAPKLIVSVWFMKIITNEEDLIVVHFLKKYCCSKDEKVIDYSAFCCIQDTIFSSIWLGSSGLPKWRWPDCC